jgi:hypothetical protein
LHTSPGKEKETAWYVRFQAKGFSSSDSMRTRVAKVTSGTLSPTCLGLVHSGWSIDSPAAATEQTKELQRKRFATFVMMQKQVLRVVPANVGGFSSKVPIWILDINRLTSNGSILSFLVHTLH